jgi:hypothetical protein
MAMVPDHMRLLLATLLLTSCWIVPGYTQTASEPTTHRVADADIREVVLRYQMLAWAGDGDKIETNAANANDKAIAKRLNTHVYFISVQGKDPSDDFLKRLQDIPRNIKKASEAKQTKRFPGWVVDKKSKQPGIVFSADQIRWTKDSEVEVEGGYHCGGLCAAGDVFTVGFERGKWKVLSVRMKWIS